MSIYEGLVARKEKLALVGLGYVGMPIAVAFAKKVDVIGFDTNSRKIALYKSGIDPTHEVGDEAIAASDEKAIIPINTMESLNAASAATVFLWEIKRRGEQVEK